MSRRRKVSIVLGVALAAVVVVLAIGIGWLYVALRPLGEFFEHGLLGPPDRRQRVEVADQRFAISFACDWVVEMEPNRLATDESRVVPVLVAGPEHGFPSCRVDVVPDGRPLDAESFLLAWAADRAPDSEVSTDIVPGSSEGVVGIGVGEADGGMAAAYWAQLAGDALIVSCEVDVAADRPPDDQGIFTSSPQAMVLWGMPPLVESIEPLPSASPGATPVVAGHGQRAETTDSLAVTLP